MGTPAPHDATTALRLARPVLQRVATGAEALGLRPHELLHAGPPLADPRRPPAPLRSAVVMTALHEGWAHSAEEAEAALLEGQYTLQPAQDRSCVTPLAAVVAAGTPLFGVDDAAAPGALVWSPVSPVRGPDTRMGHRDPAILGRLRDRDERVAPAIASLLAALAPVDLWPLAALGLAAGDDLHSRTAGANEALVTAWSSHLPPTLCDDIAATPLWFLTLWMAAAARLLRTLEHGDQPTWVTRAGGNGERFAIALAGTPDRWASCDAAPPQGWRLPSAPAAAAAQGAIGDSAVIDLLGLGGQRLALAPEPLQVLGGVLPPGHVSQAAAALCVPHPALAGGWPLGLDAARVVAAGRGPVVCLAMVAADGAGGLLGRGVYEPAMGLFRAALSGS